MTIMDVNMLGGLPNNQTKRTLYPPSVAIYVLTSPYLSPSHNSFIHFRRPALSGDTSIIIRMSASSAHVSVTFYHVLFPNVRYCHHYPGHAALAGHRSG